MWLQLLKLRAVILWTSFPLASKCSCLWKGRGASSNNIFCWRSLPLPRWFSVLNSNIRLKLFPNWCQTFPMIKAVFFRKDIPKTPITQHVQTPVRTVLDSTHNVCWTSKAYHTVLSHTEQKWSETSWEGKQCTSLENNYICLITPLSSYSLTSFSVAAYPY